MAVDALSDLLDALRTNPTLLLGTPESLWVEFKGEPYLLDKGWAKIELAKDVTALANTGNGAIVIGVATAKDADSSIDRAVALKPIPLGLIKREQIFDVVGE